MMRMDPQQLPRLLAIEADTVRLLDEARANHWEGEVIGLETTLAHIQDKKAQVERVKTTTMPADGRTQLVLLSSRPDQPTLC